MSLTRRAFLARAAVVAAALPLGAQEPTPQGKGAGVQGDTLRDQRIIGAARDSLGPRDNDPVVIALERRLRCTCGCTLDVYTCRTTDFTCTFSPALHKEIVGLLDGGKSVEAVIDLLVAREGEKMLMAPVAEGFNLAGYLVPGLTVLAVGTVLAAWLARKRPVPVAASAGPAPAAGALDDEEVARLRRALDEVES